VKKVCWLENEEGEGRPRRPRSTRFAGGSFIGKREGRRVIKRECVHLYVRQGGENRGLYKKFGPTLEVIFLCLASLANLRKGQCH